MFCKVLNVENQHGAAPEMFCGPRHLGGDDDWIYLVLVHRRETVSPAVCTQNDRKLF